MAGLGQMLREAEPIDGGFAIEIPPEWLQGRTAYGGLTSALALAAARRVDSELPPLRSGQLAMIAPLAGRIEARARVVREGRNVTWLAAELAGENGVGFTATFAFMRALPQGKRIEGYPLPPDVIALDEAAPFPPTFQPAFLRNNFDVRLAAPLQPGVARFGCWVRAREREGLDPALEALLCGDASPPAVWPIVGFDVPVSSMNWHVNLLSAQPVTADGWWLLHSTSEAACDGMTSERIVQWNSAGVPVIAGVQAVAVFG